MSLHGHATTWGTHIGIGRARSGAGWYQQFKEWWAAHKAMRREAKLASLNACWDAKDESIKPLRADAAAEMVAAQGGLSITTMLYGMSQ